MIVAAIITPPDIFTLVMVTIPIYGLYELSILVLKRCEAKFDRGSIRIADDSICAQTLLYVIFLTAI